MDSDFGECRSCGDTLAVEGFCTNGDCFYYDHQQNQPDDHQQNQPDWWLVDEVQFVRLLAEIHAAGLDRETKQVIADSMDLTTAEVESIFVRADKAWTRIHTNHA